MTWEILVINGKKQVDAHICDYPSWNAMQELVEQKLDRKPLEAMGTAGLSTAIFFQQNQSIEHFNLLTLLVKQPIIDH